MDFSSQEDRQVALAELGPGDSIGELSAIDLKVRSARVSATEHCLLASLSSKEFRTLLLDCPGISLALLKRFSGYIRTLNTRITALSTMSPHQRIYHELLRISEPNADGDGSWIIVNAPHHSEIAEWVGAEKQTVAEAGMRLSWTCWVRQWPAPCRPVATIRIPLRNRIQRPPTTIATFIDRSGRWASRR